MYNKLKEIVDINKSIEDINRYNLEEELSFNRILLEGYGSGSHKKSSFGGSSSSDSITSDGKDLFLVVVDLVKKVIKFALAVLAWIVKKIRKLVRYLIYLYNRKKEKYERERLRPYVVQTKNGVRWSEDLLPRLSDFVNTFSYNYDPKNKYSINDIRSGISELEGFTRESKPGDEVTYQFSYKEGDVYMSNFERAINRLESSVSYINKNAINISKDTNLENGDVDAVKGTIKDITVDRLALSMLTKNISLMAKAGMDYVTATNKALRGDLSKYKYVNDDSTVNIKF